MVKLYYNKDMNVWHKRMNLHSHYWETKMGFNKFPLVDLTLPTNQFLDKDMTTLELIETISLMEEYCKNSLKKLKKTKARLSRIYLNQNKNGN